MKHKGFSVIEMVVSLALFSAVALVALASMVSLVSANQKARNNKSAMDNINLVLEEMVRNLRLGDQYYCQTSAGDPISISLNEAKKDCPSPGGEYLAFRDRDGKTVYYRYDASAYGGKGCIQKKRSILDWGQSTDDLGVGYGDSSCLNAPEFSITSLRFFVYDDFRGIGQHTDIQRVVIVVRGFSGNDIDTKSSFNIMTSAGSRAIPVKR